MPLIAVVALLVGLVPVGVAAAETIAYNCGQDICLVNPDNPAEHSNLTETTAGDGDERSPAWSPDGKWIAYNGAYDGVGGGWYDVFVIDAAKSAAESEAIDISDNAETNAAITEPPRWSPDGTRVAYTEEWLSSAKTGLDVFVSPFDGSSPQLPIGQTAGGEAFPSWSPDGTKLAFNRSAGIFIGNANGSGTPTLVPNSAGSAPVWSPDGKYFAMENAGTYPYEIRIVNADGSGFHLLSKPGSLGPDIEWSADGSKVAYVGDDEPLDQIWVAPADGSSPGNPVPLPAGWIVPHNPSFSPDGTRVAFDARPTAAPTYEQILVGPADGSAPAVPITKAAMNSEEPDWKPGPGLPKPPAGGGAGNGGAPTKVPVKVRLAFVKSVVAYNGHMLIAGIDCHAQGGHPTGKVAEFCAANASAYPQGASPGARFRPLLATFAAKPKRPLFAKGKVKVPVGKTRQLKMTLTAAGKKLMRAGGQPRVKIVIKVTRPGAKAQTFTKTVTVKSGKAAKG